MKKYKIPVNIVFSGYVEVKARDKKEAAKIAVEDFGATIGECGDSCNDKIIDWDIELHGTTEEACNEKKHR